MIRIEPARTAGPATLPFLSVRARTDYHTPSSTGDQSYLEPFFIRQQFGIPFRHHWPPSDANGHRTEALQAQTVWANLCQRIPEDACFSKIPSKWFIPADEKIALAILSIQLAQRSARLTLLRQIIGGGFGVPEPWNTFRHGNGDGSVSDDGFVIDGWGDLLCVLNADRRELDDDSGGHLLPTVADLADPNGRLWNNKTFECEKLASDIRNFHGRLSKRLIEIIRFKNACFDHFLTSRTELAFTPLAGDVALRSHTDKALSEAFDEEIGTLHWSFQWRLKPDRASGTFHQRTVRRVNDWINNRESRSALHPNAPDTPMPFRLVRQAGVLDYRLSLMANPDGLQALNETLFSPQGALIQEYVRVARYLREHFDEIARSPALLAGRVFIPAAALMLVSLFNDPADAGAAASLNTIADMIDHTFTTLGTRLT